MISYCCVVSKTCLRFIVNACINSADRNTFYRDKLMLTFLKAIELIKIMPDGSFQIIGYGIQSFLTLLKDG